METILNVVRVLTWREFYWLVARIMLSWILESKGSIKSTEYDQEIPQSHTADQATTSRGKGYRTMTVTRHQEDSYSMFAAEPSFRVPEINVTAVEGDTAVLPCSIQFLGEHKVIWTDDESFLLTLADRRIIDDDRMSVERPFTKDWNLHIRDVRYSDQGRYICQINTEPVKVKHVQLIVLVPPIITDEATSADMVVQEGDTVTLVCNASGVPIPNVSWFRIGTQPFHDKERIGSMGEVLIIHNVSRECGGKYECEADNKIGDIARRQMFIDVQYPPEVYLPNRKMGQYPGKETFLQCEVTAHPHGIMYWSKDGIDLDIGLQTEKYTVEMYSGDDQEKKILSLRIRGISGIDFGRYACIAKNFLGEDRETMFLYDYSMTLPKTTRPTTLLPKLHTSTTVDKSKIKTKEGVDTIIQSSIASAGSKYYKDHKQLIGEVRRNSSCRLSSNFSLQLMLLVVTFYLASL